VIDEIFAKIGAIPAERRPNIHLQLILGYPNESEEDFQMTLDFVRRHHAAIERITSCSAFLAIVSESDDISEMLATREFGLNIVSQSNWASRHSTPSIRL